MNSLFSREKQLLLFPKKRTLVSKKEKRINHKALGNLAHIVGTPKSPSRGYGALNMFDLFLKMVHS